VLVPALKPGQVVIIDNATFHKSQEIIDLIKAAGCRVIFLPPYSPDLNPIEHSWAALKKSIRRIFYESNNFFEAAVQTMEQMCRA
jgi:transposase